MKRPDLEKMKQCSPLLPDPGPEVMCEVIDYALALEREVKELRGRISGALTVMGPSRPSCCEGCEWEWDEALRILKDGTEKDDTETTPQANAGDECGECGGKGKLGQMYNGFVLEGETIPCPSCTGRSKEGA